MRPASVLVAFIAAVVFAVPVRADEFDAHWHDGKAELDGYRLTVSRYGQERSGTAVMVFVTEPFSESRRVKVNDAKAHPSDTFDALKLNLIRDFQTGIYDYNTMVSLFTRSRDFSAVKTSTASSCSAARAAATGSFRRGPSAPSAACRSTAASCSTRGFPAVER